MPKTITRRLALLGPATVALGAAAFSSAPARAAMKTTDSIDYSHGNTKLKVYVAYDDGVTGKRPAIFMVHARNGLTDFAKQQAEEWSKLGYYVFATDMFGMLPKNLEEITAQTDMFRKDRTLMKARAQAGFDTLAKQPLVDASRIALIGYCFGGTVGAEFGSTGAPLVANVAIHGSFGGHAAGWAKNAKGMFLILQGAEDPNYPVELSRVIDELKAARTPFEVELYSGTAHGFSQPKNKAEERAIAQANATTGRTLKELFGV
jgi:dienelactone hydrolase